MVRVAADQVSQCHLNSQEPFLFWRLCLWEEREADLDRRGPRAQDLWPPQADRCVGGLHQGSSRGLHQLGGVRAQSGAARRQRLWQSGRDEVRTGRPRTSGRPHLLRTLWPSAQRYLHRSLSSPSLPVRQAEPAAWAAALLQLRRQAHRCDNRRRDAARGCANRDRGSCGGRAHAERRGQGPTAHRRARAAAGPVRCIVGRTSLCRLRPRQSPDRSAAGEGVGGRVATCRDLPAAARWNA